MRCHICDAVIEKPAVNPITRKYEPCDKCMTAALPERYSDIDEFFLEDVRDAEGGYISEDDV